jgi:CMP-N,N'-diacetyllegionaminic acid synthase
MQLLGIIPARGGSKGILGKNIKLLGGKPLLAYTFIAAKSAGVFSRIVLSTDSEEIAAVGRQLGIEVPFIRPPELARDDTPMLPVLQHVVKNLGTTFDAIAILQPTAPFRRWQDLRAAAELLEQNPEVESVVSVEPVPEHYSPYFLMKIESDRLLPFMTDGLKITRRQDAPKAYSRSGDFYFTRTRTLLEKGSIYGENCRPFIVNHKHRVNLDTMNDWQEAEKLVDQFLAETFVPSRGSAPRS